MYIKLISISTKNFSQSLQYKAAQNLKHLCLTMYDMLEDLLKIYETIDFSSEKKGTEKLLLKISEKR